MYRYIIHVYRYTLHKKWQWAKCTGTHVQKIDSSESVPVHLHGNCEIRPEVRSVREGTLVNEPKWENHIGGEYKSKKAQVKESFCFSRVSVLKGEEFSLHF